MAKPLVDPRIRFAKTKLYEHIYGFYSGYPVDAPVANFNEINTPVENSEAFPTMLYWRDQYLANNRFRGRFPYKIYVCTEIRPTNKISRSRLELMPNTCRDCPVRRRTHVSCPLRILLEQNTEQNQTALLAGFRLIE